MVLWISIQKTSLLPYKKSSSTIIVRHEVRKLSEFVGTCSEKHRRIPLKQKLLNRFPGRRTEGKNKISVGSLLYKIKTMNCSKER